MYINVYNISVNQHDMLLSSGLSYLNPIKTGGGAFFARGPTFF